MSLPVIIIVSSGSSAPACPYISTQLDRTSNCHSDLSDVSVALDIIEFTEPNNKIKMRMDGILEFDIFSPN